MAVVGVAQAMVARSCGRVGPAGDRSPRRLGAGVRGGAAAVSPDQMPGEDRAPWPPLRGASGCAHASRGDPDEFVYVEHRRDDFCGPCACWPSPVARITRWSTFMSRTMPRSFKEASFSQNTRSSGQCPRWGSNPHKADFKDAALRRPWPLPATMPPLPAPPAPRAGHSRRHFMPRTMPRRGARVRVKRLPCRLCRGHTPPGRRPAHHLDGCGRR